MTTDTNNIVLSTRDYDTVGKRPIRHDGHDKVTGKAHYGADIRLPGLLYARTLQSPHAHARILSIDASKVLALPGVRAMMALLMTVVPPTQLAWRIGIIERPRAKRVPQRDHMSRMAP